MNGAIKCASVLTAAHTNGFDSSRDELVSIAGKSNDPNEQKSCNICLRTSMIVGNGCFLFIDKNSKSGLHPIERNFKHDNLMFVVADSMAKIDFEQSAPQNQNLKLIETRLAAAVLQQYLKLPIAPMMPTLKSVYASLFDSFSIENLDIMIKLVQKYLHRKDYSLDEVATILDISTLQLSLTFIAPVLIRAEGFALFDRALHVFTEAKRVLQFQECLLNSDYMEMLPKLGLIMNESHSSSRDLFLNIILEVEELIAVARYIIIDFLERMVLSAQGQLVRGSLFC